MAEQFTATTTHGDFYGEVAIDGYQGAFHCDLGERAGLPGGYWPIGFSLHALGADEQGVLDVELIAVRLSEYDIDTSVNIPEQLYRVAQDVEELRAYPIDMKISFADFASLIREFSMKVHLPQIRQDIIRVDYDNALVVAR